MSRNDKILDIPKIQNHIREKHSEFIKQYASQVEKVMADHKLLSDIITAKLYRIAICFKEERVIDDIRIFDSGPGRKLTLLKNGSATYIDIRTNGKMIILEGYTYSQGMSSDCSSLSEKFYNVDVSDFDWVGFSSKLLDYIHKIIYGRQEALEEKVRSIFDEKPDRSEDVKIIKNVRKSK